MTDGVTFGLLIVQWLVFAYFVCVNAIYTLFIVVSLREINRYAKTLLPERLHRMFSGMWYRPISILVPAYNEERTIVANVKSLLALHYPEFEVVVINDGSQDSTLAKLVAEFSLIKVDQPIRNLVPHKPIEGVYVSAEYPMLTVVDKQNGGESRRVECGD